MTQLQTKVLGSEVIVDAFERHGLERIYVYPGGTIGSVLDVATKRGLPIYCSRHEQGAGYAALAASRLTGKAQVVMVTSGPGVTNLATPIADAYFDSYPLVVMTGQVGTGDMRGSSPVRQRGFQEIDAVALLRPITKAQFLPTSAEELPEILERAFAIASEGRPGPVLIDLPGNVQKAELEARPVPRAEVAEPIPEPDPAAIAQAAEWLLQSERPVILAGQGVVLGQATEQLRHLADRCQIPVSQSLPGLGSFPTTSPLALGFHGHTGNQYAGRAIHHADFLLVVGSRLDLRQTGTRVDEFVPGGRVVRIDLDATELAYPRVRSHLDIRAQAGAALAALNQVLARRSLPDWLAWRSQVARWRAEFPLAYDRSGPLKPQFVIETANRLTAGQELICVSGVGSHQQWVARHFDFDYPRRMWFTSAGHGAMGFDLPVAIGAQLVRPDVPVLCFVGDGSIQMNIQELASVVAYELPVKIIVIDNRRLGIVSQFQLFSWGSDPTCGDKWNPDFAAIAAAYGIPSRSARTEAEADLAVRWALSEPGPALVHCHVDPAEEVVPMLMAGQTMDKMWPHA